MATSTLVACGIDAWTKIATNVTGASFEPKITGPIYYWLTVNTGAAAPTDLTITRNLHKTGVSFSATAASDLYVYAQGKAGSVVIDL